MITWTQTRLLLERYPIVQCPACSTWFKDREDLPPHTALVRESTGLRKQYHLPCKGKR